KDIEPEETEDRPGSERCEQQPEYHPEADQHPDEDPKAGAAERSVRDQQGSKQWCIGSIHFAHDPDYRASMSKPKQKGVASPGGMPGSRNEVRASPRPRRGAPTAYTPAEIDEMF